MILDIKSIEVKNFLSFGNSWQTFDFSEGLNLIIGKVAGSNSSNGSGKSALLDAIIFGLYGKVTKDINKDQIPNWKNKKHCEVKISFQKGKDNFIIHRGINPTLLKLYKNGNEEDQLSHNREFQEEIETLILGIDYETFLSVAHYNATQSTSIFNVSKGAKRAFLEKLFGLEVYTELLIKCNNKASLISNKLTTIQNEIGFNSKIIIDAEAQNNRCVCDIQTINIDELEEQLKNLEKDKKELVKENRIVTTRITELQEKERKIQEKIETSTGVITDFNKKLYSLEGKAESIVVKNLSFDVEVYKQIQEEKIKIDTQLNDTNLVSLKEHIQNQTAQKDRLIKEINKVDVEIALYKGKLDSIPKYSVEDESGFCPLCNSEVSIDHINEHTKEKRDTYNTEIENLEQIKQEKRVELKHVKADIEETEESVEYVEKLLKNQQSINEKLLKLNNEKEESRQNNKNKEEKDKILVQIKKLEEKISNEQEVLTKYNKMLRLINAQVKELQDTSDKLSILDENIQIVKNSIEIKDAEIRRIKGFIKENQEKIDESKRNITSLDKQEKKFKNMLDYLDYIRKITKDEGVRNYAIQNTIPFLTKKVNEYLSSAGCTFYLKLDSMLNAEIRGPGILNATFGSLSSGQQKVTNVAMLLAFLDLFKLRSPVHVNILLLDEILDSAVDSITLTQLMNIIHKKQQDENLKCYLVSHRKEISEIPEFDNIYRIEKIDGFSHVNKVAV